MNAAIEDDLTRAGEPPSTGAYFSTCADLCEASGFLGPASALRALDAGQFWVVRRGFSVEQGARHGFDPKTLELPGRYIFLNPAAAEGFAKVHSVRALQNFVPKHPGARNLSNDDVNRYCRDVGRILGLKSPYELPAPLGTRAFPARASDDQLWSISKLFSPRIFEVVALGKAHELRGKGLMASAGRRPRGPAFFRIFRIIVDAERAREQRLDAQPPPWTGAPSMDDFLACSDLCEENQFARQAAILRAMAGASGKVYVVAERDVDYNDENMFLHDGDGQPRSLFFDRAEAEHAAEARTATKLRELPLLEYGVDLSDFTSLPTESELNRRVGSILGIDFDLWSYNEGECPFPPEATDDQMIALAALFDKLRFFHVIEAEFGG